MRPDPDPPTLFWMNTVLTGSQLPQVADVVLRDGSTMRFEAPRADDRDRLLAFFRQLSDRSVYLRFHGHPAIGAQMAEPILDPDWRERGTLVGTKEDRVVAVANYVRLRDVRTAEVAFAVADDRVQPRIVLATPRPGSGRRDSDHAGVKAAEERDETLDTHREQQQRA